MARIGIRRLWKARKQIVRFVMQVCDALDPAGRHGRDISTSELQSIFDSAVQLSDALGITKGA